MATNYTVADDPIQEVLGRLQKVTKTGEQQWEAACPSHDDGSPSLSVSRGGNVERRRQGTAFPTSAAGSVGTTDTHVRHVAEYRLLVAGWRDPGELARVCDVLDLRYLDRMFTPRE